MVFDVSFDLFPPVYLHLFEFLACVPFFDAGLLPYPSLQPVHIFAFAGVLEYLLHVILSLWGIKRFVDTLHTSHAYKHIYDWAGWLFLGRNVWILSLREVFHVCSVQGARTLLSSEACLCTHTLWAAKTMALLAWPRPISVFIYIYIYTCVECVDTGYPNDEKLRRWLFFVPSFRFALCELRVVREVCFEPHPLLTSIKT